jgi:hypothetical protein
MGLGAAALYDQLTLWSYAQSSFSTMSNDYGRNPTLTESKVPGSHGLRLAGRLFGLLAALAYILLSERKEETYMAAVWQNIPLRWRHITSLLILPMAADFVMVLVENNV